MSVKKQNQLGMNPSTASHRLVKDLLWNFIKLTGNDNCCKCGTEMDRSNFSIEHVQPWLDSENPLELYFDVDNISYSHLKCNVGDRRRDTQSCGTYASYRRGCRCIPCKNASSEKSRSKYCPETRSKRYALNSEYTPVE